VFKPPITSKLFEASMAATSRRILVVGGGPAGATAAFWLAKAGFEVTVAERATNKFAYGQGIDITGPAVKIVQKMGVYDTIKSRVTGEAGFAFLDDHGDVIAAVGTAENENGKGLSLTQEIEIMRGDVTQILADRAKESERVTYRYGCTVTELRQTEGCVTAVLSDTGEAEEFAAVIGADGIMSRTRKLAFPQDILKDCYKGQDQYTAFFSIPHQAEDVPNARVQHAAGGRAVLIRPTNIASPERSSCYIIDTGISPALEQALTQSTGEQKALFAKNFAEFPSNTGDRVLQGMWEAKDFYLAQTAQIKLPKWSHGRVVLSGDAAYCPSPPTGMGTVLAILGSYIIAGEMVSNRDDPEAAFAKYEERLRTYVEKAQYVPLAGFLPRLGNPQSRLGVRMLRLVFWMIAWTGIWKLINIKEADDKFVLPEYDFERN
jgi:2-polyprenyl-6-methoxyphenol hydroxylase-like FAD-dependent oxidoreductase